MGHLVSQVPVSVIQLLPMSLDESVTYVAGPYQVGRAKSGAPLSFYMDSPRSSPRTRFEIRYRLRLYIRPVCES